MAGLLAIASFGMVMFSTFNADLRRNLAAADVAAADVAPVTAEAVIAQRAKLAAIELPASTSADIRITLRRAVAEAFVSGFRRVMLLAASLALASAISAWVMIGDGRAPTRPVDVEHSRESS